MEQLAAAVADVGLASHQHLAMLRDVEELRRVVLVALPNEPDAQQVRALSYRLDELQQAGAAQGNKGRGRSRRTAARSLSEVALDALGDGPQHFPSLEEDLGEEA